MLILMAISAPSITAIGVLLAVVNGAPETVDHATTEDPKHDACFIYVCTLVASHYIPHYLILYFINLNCRTP